MPPEQEIEGLKKQAEELRRHMDRISERIAALKNKEK
jgi:hypothetical protein